MKRTVLRDPARRRLLRYSLAAAASGAWPALTIAGAGRPDGKRFALVILRGGMDGLGAVPAPGDPEHAAARGALAQLGAAPLALDATFALHPHLAHLHDMVKKGDALVVHAVGVPYRERSHFDAQQLLESGGTRPHQLTTGWLGRALAASGARGIALDAAVPLVLRGSDLVDSWAPSLLPDPSPDLLARLESLYADDAALARALERAKGLRDDAGTGVAGSALGGRRMLAVLARKAGDFLAQPNGPLAAVLEIGGWDSHANQTSPNGAFANQLKALDGALAALRDGLAGTGNAWARTVVVVATEFGREVAMNGTRGTDHGSGGAAFVLGGALKGGGVIADWPGLGKRDRFEGRDLRVTTDLRALLKGVLADHLRIAPSALERDVFPDSASVKPLRLV